VENPVGFLGRQTRGEHTQRTNHTFQLLHRLVLKGRLERTKQRCNLRVGHQDLEDGLIALVEERQDVRHVAVLAQPVGRLCHAARGIADNARGLNHARLGVDGLVIVQLMAILVVRTLLVVAVEVDARGQEVDGRRLEELVTTATALLLAFLERLQQGLRRFTCSRQIADVLQLDGIDPSAVLHIYKIDDVLTSRVKTQETN